VRALRKQIKEGGDIGGNYICGYETEKRYFL
jgi:hypothetical protein